MTTTTLSVSADQYRALQRPVVLPTSEEVFTFQVDTLRYKGIDVPEEDVERLHELIPSDPQLFLVVPSQPDDLEGLMAKVDVNGKTGKNYLDRQFLSNVVDAPKTAHLLLDVEDGRNRLNTKPSVSFEKIQQEGRTPYTTWQGIIHAIVFPHVFQTHNMDLVGSRYRSGGVPYLDLDGGFPRLRSLWYDVAYSSFGAPSAGSVVGA